MSSLVYSVARMHNTGEPCRIPFVTGFILSWMPSKHIATCLSFRNAAVHLTIVSGIPFARVTFSRHGWLTKSKYPFMSKHSADVTRL
ncbi:hypothetical protein K439DRAFT_1362202 [Ramaria rubella]|nr:hypothetical protein K439DRAFT_1362202 [Ramaria rubella]